MHQEGLRWATPDDVEPYSSGPLLRVEAGGHGVTTIRVRGEVDIATAPSLEGSLDGVDRAAWRRAVVVDMSDVTFLDCAGLSACLALRAQAVRAAAAFSLVHVRGPAGRVFALTGHAHLIRGEPDRG